MPYYATGENRDSYVTGVRPGNRYGAPHDVEKRRDNLPDNVFNYIKEGVQREQRQQCIEDDARARTRLEMFARPPKTRGANGGAGAFTSTSSGTPDANAQRSQLERESENRERHAALVELYARERQQWEEQLRARGLATQRF